MFRILFLLAAAAATATLTGCAEMESKANAGKSATTQTAEKEKKGDGLMKEAFAPPAPSTPADDPRVVQAKSSSEAITAALASVRQRLTAIRGRLEIRPSENDLAAVVAELKSMTAAARSDCDAVLRAAEDLRAELLYAQESYENAAASFRSRARGYKEPLYQSSTEQMAEQMDRLAEDTPRRAQVAERFIAEVVKARRFLAETNKFLHQTDAAVSMLSVAPDAPRPSPKAEHIRSYLGQFLDAVERFQAELLKAPWSKPAEAKTVTPPAKPEPVEKAAPEGKEKPPAADTRESKPLGPTPAPEQVPEKPKPASKANPVPPAPLAPVASSPKPLPAQVARSGAPAPPAGQVSWNTRSVTTGETLVFCYRCGAYHPVSPQPTFAYRPVVLAR